MRPATSAALGARRNDVWLHLSEHLGDARPDTLVHLYVDDVDTIAQEFDVVIRTQPWAREIELTDPDGKPAPHRHAVRSFVRWIGSAVSDADARKRPSRWPRTPACDVPRPADGGRAVTGASLVVCLRRLRRLI